MSSIGGSLSHHYDALPPTIATLRQSEIMLPDFSALFTRPFWLDEWHTVLVANRGSLAELLSDLRHGSDFGPPFLHVALWTMRAVFGPITPTMLRIFSFTCVLAAIAFIYLALRRRVGRMAALAGALAVASHAHVALHAFEGRFYAPMLFSAAAFAWALSLDTDRPSSLRRDITLAIASVILCTSHWFGVLVLGLMCAGALATYGRRWPEGIRRIAPAAAAVVALLLCAPLILGQRGVMPNWMPNLNAAQVRLLVREYWTAWVPLVATLALLGVALYRPGRATLRATISSALRDQSIAALLVLTAMPVVLAVVSMRHPAMLPRYALSAAFAWAPLVAFAAHFLGRVVRVAAVAALAFVVLLRLAAQVGEQRRFADAVDYERRMQAKACDQKVPVLFLTRHVMYPTAADESVRCANSRYLAMSDAALEQLFPDGSGSEGYQRFFRIENVFALLHERLYGFPIVSLQSQMDSVPVFILLEREATIPMGRRRLEDYARIVFPHHEPLRLAPTVTAFQRK